MTDWGRVRAEVEERRRQTRASDITVCAIACLCGTQGAREKRGVMGELESTKRLLDERQERSRAAVENMYRQIVGVG